MGGFAYLLQSLFVIVVVNICNIQGHAKEGAPKSSSHPTLKEDEFLRNAIKRHFGTIELN